MPFASCVAALLSGRRAACAMPFCFFFAIYARAHARCARRRHALRRVVDAADMRHSSRLRAMPPPLLPMMLMPPLRFSPDA